MNPTPWDVVWVIGHKGDGTLDRWRTFRFAAVWMSQVLRLYYLSSPTPVDVYIEELEL